jgi:DNA polymerase-3 subunit epsilon
MMRQIFFDTETTGLDADKGDRIIEIGCLEMVDRRLTGNNLHLYLNPERSSHPDALKVHGLTDEFLADKPKFAEVADDLLAVPGRGRTGHPQRGFDVVLRQRRTARLGGRDHRRGGQGHRLAADGARDVPRQGQFAGRAVPRLEVDNSNRTLHGALLDAGLLAEVYIRMTRGQGSLVIDSHDGGGPQLQVAAVDLSTFTLPVLLASDDEGRGPRSRAEGPGQGQRRQDALACGAASELVAYSWAHPVNGSLPAQASDTDTGQLAQR